MQPSKIYQRSPKARDKELHKPEEHIDDKQIAGHRRYVGEKSAAWRLIHLMSDLRFVCCKINKISPISTHFPVVLDEFFEVMARFFTPIVC